MSIVKFSELRAGEIYVTVGGWVIMRGDEDKKRIPWGYDRVRFVRAEKKRIIVEVPWGGTCELPIDYPLQTTTETVMRSEFPLRGMHAERKNVSFDKALEQGVCKEIEASKLKQDKPDAVIHHKASATAKNDFAVKLIEYFVTAKTMAGAAEHFGVKYQKVRYTIKNLKDKGYGVQRFNVVTAKNGGLTTVKLEKVKK